MTEHVGHDDRENVEPRDRFHPEYESFEAWLNAEAPPHPDGEMFTPSQSEAKAEP